MSSKEEIKIVQTLENKNSKEVDKKSWAEEVEDEEAELEAKVQQLTVPHTKDEDAPQMSLLEKLALNSGKLIVEQDDPKSPLHSAKSFDDLNLAKELKAAIFEMGFTRPSKIQETALPAILANPPRNLIAQAQSGTGKTAAFVLGMLSRSDPEVKFPQAMCICPTRELAIQIHQNVKLMGKYSKVQSILVVKDEIFPKRIEAQLIVGTPGKMIDLVTKRIIDSTKIKVLVLDEADVMIQEKLGEQSIKLRNFLPKNCQILLFSATFAESVRKFAERMVPQPCFNIKIQLKELTLDKIQQLYIDCKSEANKFHILSDIYGYLTVGQSIIFVHTRRTATELAERMKVAGHTVSLIHGGEDLGPQARDQVIADFRTAKTKVLISTNVLARGIDILSVTMVINYDIPLNAANKPDPETYLHRIGRSGRFGRYGIAINFVHDEISKANLKAIEHHWEKPINPFPAEKIEDLQGLLEAIDKKQKLMEAEMKAKGITSLDDE